MLEALHVYRTYFPDPQGGMQEAIRQLCLATRAQGVSNTIFTLAQAASCRDSAAGGAGCPFAFMGCPGVLRPGQP